MAGRYVLTPARRAALKKAQAKSAAKRRGRGQYRRAKKKIKRSVNAEYAKNPSHKNLKAARAKYDRQVNDARVKYKGKKYRSDRYLKNKRRAINTTANAVALTPYAASVYVTAKDLSIRKKTGGAFGYDDVRKAKKRNRQANKANRAQQKVTIKRVKQNLAAAGLNPDGSVGRRRKPTKVRSQRVSQKALTAGRGSNQKRRRTR